MSKFLKTAALLLMTALCANLNAQTISAADQKGIEATYKSFMKAFDTLDPSGLPALLTENAEHVPPTGALIRGRYQVAAAMGGYIEFLKTQPKPDKMEYVNKSLESRYLAKDVILSTYTEETTITLGAETLVELMTAAIVMRKVNGNWLAELVSLTPVIEMPQH